MPALDEALNLSIHLLLPPTAQDSHKEPILVDGRLGRRRRGSPTTEPCRRTSSPSLQGRKGQGDALAAGFARVAGDIVVMFYDADGSADPARVARFVEALTDGRGLSPRAEQLHRGRRPEPTSPRSSASATCILRDALFERRASRPATASSATAATRTQHQRAPPARSTGPAPRPAPANGNLDWSNGFGDLSGRRLPLRGRRCPRSPRWPSVEKTAGMLRRLETCATVSDGLQVLRTLLTERRRASVHPPDRSQARLDSSALVAPVTWKVRRSPPDAIKTTGLDHSHRARARPEPSAPRSAERPTGAESTQNTNQDSAASWCLLDPSCSARVRVLFSSTTRVRCASARCSRWPALYAAASHDVSGQPRQVTWTIP